MFYGWYVVGGAALIAVWSWALGFYGLSIYLITATNQFTFAFGPGLMGVLRDYTGGYGAALAMCIGLEVVAAGIILLGRRGHGARVRDARHERPATGPARDADSRTARSFPGPQEAPSCSFDRTASAVTATCRRNGRMPSSAPSSAPSAARARRISWPGSARTAAGSLCAGRCARRRRSPDTRRRRNGWSGARPAGRPHREGDHLMSRPEVIVVGAGVVGACVALRLAQGGARVTVVEAMRPGAGASRASFAWANSFNKPPRPYHDLNVAGMAEHAALAQELGGRWLHGRQSQVGAFARAPGRVASGHGTAPLWGYPIATLTPREARELEPRSRSIRPSSAWSTPPRTAGSRWCRW